MEPLLVGVCSEKTVLHHCMNSFIKEGIQFLPEKHYTELGQTDRLHLHGIMQVLDSKPDII